MRPCSYPAAMASQPLQTSCRRRGDAESGGASDGCVVLPWDALYEILLHVPAWAALCLCQSWRTLLSGPRFLTAHAARHRHRDPLFAVCGAGEVAEIKLLDASGCVVKRVGAGPPSSSRIRPHLDLVLIRADANHHPLRVLDPATGAVSVLPDIGVGFYCSTFAFGRAVSPTGGDGDYKVLSLRAGGPQLCRVLTVDISGGGSSQGTWRAAPGPPVTITTLNGTLVASGVAYHLVHGTIGWMFAAFDLEAEQWRPDLLQGPAAPRGLRRSMAVVNNRLAAVAFTVTRSTFDMWLLMDSGEWCRQGRVVTSSIEQRYWWCMAIARPLWVLDDGRVAIWVGSSLRSDGTLWMYDPRTEMCTHLAKGPTLGVGVYNWESASFIMCRRVVSF